MSVEEELKKHFDGKGETKSIIAKNDEITTDFVSMPLEEAPSKAKYYPLDTDIKVKSLSTFDVKNYSKMDVTSTLSVENSIDQAMEKNIRVIFPSGIGSFKDLTQSDRIHFLFLLREATMRNYKSKRELTQTVKHPTKQGVEKKITVDHNVFEYYDMPKGIEKWYNSLTRNYHIYDDKESPIIDISLFIPTIGTINWIKKHIRDMEIRKQGGEEIYYDETFYKYLQFLVPDWRVLNEDFVKSKQEWYESLSVEENEILVDAVDKITLGIKPTIKVKFDDGEEVIVPLRFRDYKSIFAISNRSASIFSDTE